MAQGMLSGYAMPVSGAGFVGDHVYVTDDNGNAWGCHGRSAGGTPICTGPGNIDQANCLAQIDENGGIAYPFEGVCHQIANRILYAANPPLLVSQARGFRISMTMYGVYGLDLYTGSHYSPAHNPWPELRACNNNHYHP